MNKPIFYIDLFAGAGGTTTGIHLVNDNVKVVACVNHDLMAIESHKANHPDCLHFVEDVRDFKVVKALKVLVDKLRKEHPECIIGLWASLECTNYSNAKGGLPKDEDSRTLGRTLYMRHNPVINGFIAEDSYIQILKPDFIDIENVREFMSWGPLDKNGRPISRLKGIEYLDWVENIEFLGYNYDYRMLNAADYGGHTSRNRFFGQFAKEGFPIVWPKPTHSKKATMYTKRWKPVKEVLELGINGKSIFLNKRITSENTDKRILAGLNKFIPKGNDMFIHKYYSGPADEKLIDPDGPAHTITTIDHHSTVFTTRYNGGKVDPEEKAKTIDQPIGTISTNNRHSLVHPEFLVSYNGNPVLTTPEQPSPTLTTKDRLSLIQPQFLMNYYSGGGQHTKLDDPSPTVLKIPKQRLISTQFIDQQFGNSKPHSINKPVNSLQTNPKFNLITGEQRFLFNLQYKSKGSDINKPYFTLIARMDKAPPSIITCENKFNYSGIEICLTRTKYHRVCDVLSDGTLIYYFSTHDTPTRRKIKMFMIQHGLTDIKMRMLMVIELLRIQGFPDDYVLKGTETQKKKYIGNAVHPQVAKHLIEAKIEALEKLETITA